MGNSKNTTKMYQPKVEYNKHKKIINLKEREREREKSIFFTIEQKMELSP